MSSKGTDSKFFSSKNANSEANELKTELNSLNKDKVKDGVKKTIAAMTVGKDVSGLFTDVVKSMQTADVELKKLIYLYVINYARGQPDKAILIVNTFQRDASDSDPLIRALALRTMGCIRVDRITEYLCEPLAKALKDKDPYVRKTAAICVAKLHEINAELAEEQGFIDSLRNLVGDSNPMVVGNAVAALAEISELSGVDMFQINSARLSKLLVALNECTEWGQVYILDCLAKYEPSAKEAEDISERVAPRLKHANAAVSMSAVRVIVKYLGYMKSEEVKTKMITQKLPPPLITLLGEHQSEIQYVALRNINLIVQKYPNLLQNCVKHFFCKYDDPVYVKMEKLAVMVQLANIKNVDAVLSEFKEYASEVHIPFVRKAVSAIGQCAIKLEKAAERCIKVLLDLIQTKVNYVVQQAIISIKDIFRKYPNRYESIISTLCENLDTLDEPTAKASMIWIVGEYAERIDNAPDLLESFVDSFQEENAEVQLSLLTATVKLFLKRPEDGQEMISTVLNMATDDSDNPDLRDRGYIYWRLLSSDPETAQRVVLAKKPVLANNSYLLDAPVLDALINNLSTLASVYHKPPEMFVDGAKASVTLAAAKKKTRRQRQEYSDSDSDSDSDGSSGGDDDDDDDDADSSDSDEAEAAPSKEMDLLDLGSLNGGGAPANAPAGNAETIVLPQSANKGVQVRNIWLRRNNMLCMGLTFDNCSNQPINQFAIKFNTNFMGLAPASPLRVGTVQPGASGKFLLPLQQGAVNPTGKLSPLQCALKTDLGAVIYFNAPLPSFMLFSEDGQLSEGEFLQAWGTLPASSETNMEVQNRVHRDVAAIKSRMAQANVFFIADRKVPARGDVSYYSLKIKGVSALVEICINGSATSQCVKTSEPALSSAVMQGVAQLLTTV